MPTGSFTIDAVIRYAGVTHSKISGVDRGAIPSQVQGEEWNGAHEGFARASYIDFTLGAGATKIFSDTEISRIGAAFVFATDGNEGGCFVQFYRAGTFNTVVGTSLGGSSYGFRGTTFSAGATGFSFFLEGNSAGHRLELKNTAAFSRTFRFWEFAVPKSVTLAAP